jgi:predicted transcriptional regulator
MSRRKTDDETSKNQRDVDPWQLEEIRAGLRELDEGRGVAHEKVSAWLRSWGRKGVRK